MLKTVLLEYLLTLKRIEKLDYYGIRGVAKDWFPSYSMSHSMDLIHLSNQYQLGCHKDLF